MLEMNAVDGMVDEATYSHVIRKWVKDVRNRSGRESLPQPLEVSQLSDSEVGPWASCCGSHVVMILCRMKMMVTNRTTRIAPAS